jgi:hypothetical protein
MKTLQNTIAIVALTTLLFSSNLFAQNSGNATAEVKIQLKKGLSIANQGASEINFGEVVVTTSEQTPTVEEGSGAHFLVTGHPNKAVTISFLPVTLSNNVWVGVNGGTQSIMTFTPMMEETGSTSTYPGSGTAVATDDNVDLVNVSGIGNLNLWVGGTMTIAANQAHGDYTGTLTVSVAY